MCYGRFDLERGPLKSTGRILSIRSYPGVDSQVDLSSKFCFIHGISEVIYYSFTVIRESIAMHPMIIRL